MVSLGVQARRAVLAMPLSALGPLPWDHCPGAVLAAGCTLASHPITPPSQCHEDEVDSRAPGIAGTFPPPHLPISEGQGPVWGHQHVPGHR